MENGEKRVEEEETDDRMKEILESRIKLKEDKKNQRRKKINVKRAPKQT